MTLPQNKSIAFLLLLLTVVHINSKAQQLEKNLQKKKSLHHSAIKKNNIIPGILIVKLKPEYREYTNKLTSLKNDPKLQASLGKVNLSKFEQMFPNSKAPASAYNSRKQKNVDISLIHIIHYDSAIQIEELISKFMTSGIVEYAEPQYNEGMLYMPNDPWSQPDSAGALLLTRINAYNAWNVEKGDTNVVIGVIDTGTELNHPDIVNSIKYNYADPINGLDDEGDGYIDNHYGWDVGNNDNNPTWQVAAHGLEVQGACNATADNNLGTTGTGFHCKSLPIKITDSSGNLIAGYQGIVYAADHKVKVINLSWGGYGTPSQSNQDIINYAAINNDVLMVAAAGNTEGELDFYPASYNNVISVTGLDTITSPKYDTLVERRTTFNQTQFPGSGMSYSFNVDMASLQGGVSTVNVGTWGNFGGSSFASPTVAGAAALVRSKYPNLSGLQAAELLRVTGEILDTFDVTRPESRYKIGRKLNMYNALTNTNTPSIRMLSYNISGRYGSSSFFYSNDSTSGVNNFFNGDTISISNNFFNYLSKSNNTTITMKCINGYATMLDSISVLGSIDSLSSKTNTSDPFKLIINSNAGPGQIIEVVMILKDPSVNYYDYQGFKFTVNPTYLNIDTNLLKTTVTSIGRIGFNVYDPYNGPSEGLGVLYNSIDTMLYEAGFMIGTSASSVSDCIRSIPYTYDNEFKSVQNVHYIHSNLKDMAANSIFNDSLASSVIGVQIEQRSYAWKNTPNNKFVILEYQITNKSSTTYDSIFAGIFTDWDIYNYAYNQANWDATHKVSYTYCQYGPVSPKNGVAGVALLTNNAPSCFSMDQLVQGGSVGGNNINPNDATIGFSTAEKYTTLSSGIGRAQAGIYSSGTYQLGDDVSQVTGAKITNLAPGNTATVAFALIAGDNIADLLASAQSARSKFISIKQGPVPNAPNAVICNQDTTNFTFVPTNGNQYAFFKNPPPAAPLYTGTSYTFTNISKPDTIYIANNDSLFYSNLETVYIKKDSMMLAYLPNTDTTIVTNGSLLLTNQSTGTASFSWNLGDGNTASSNSVSHQYDAIGTYKIYLSGISPLGCYDTLSRIVKVTNITGTTDVLNGTNVSFYPNPVVNTLTIDFSNNMPPSDLSIELINAVGITVYASTNANTSTILNIGDYPSGIYYVKLKSGDGVLNKKIVKN
jgi:serine protease